MRKCPNCGKILKYKHHNTFREAIRSNRVCYKCAGKNRRKPNKSFWDRKKNAPYYRLCPNCGDRIKYSDYTAIWRAKKQKSVCMRCSAVRRHERRGQLYPNFNLKACKLFDEINRKLGWNGQHADNGGEYYIKGLGYWVDYYEPSKNIVIEYLEPYHKKQKKNDEVRKKRIINKLRCVFIELIEK